MRAVWAVMGITGALVCAAPVHAQTPAEPRLISVHPFAGQRGTTFLVTVRGNALRNATSVFLNQAPFTAAIEGAEAEPPDTSTGRKRPAGDLVRLRIQSAPDAKPGRYMFRLVTPQGLSNTLPFYITQEQVDAEPEGSHDSHEAAVAVSHVPALFTGRIAKRGETDYYAFDAAAGQTLTFEVTSGLPAPGAAGGNAAGFDPALSIFEPSGSWFDSSRLNRVAFNDEPLWVIGRPTDAHLVHTFARGGRHFLRVEAFSGQGGPDYSYQLRILPGEHSAPATSRSNGWEERSFTRRLAAGRLNQLAERGGKPQEPKSIETYRPAAVSAEAPVFKLPASLEGEIARPGEAHHARFHLDGGRDIAIEIETPAEGPPLFNPVVRLLGADGQEVATNLSAGRGACSGEMNKSLQAKTIVPLRDPGDYTVEIRDLTADLAGPGFRYRVQVRPQIPHIGQVRIDEDHVNLLPGAAKSVRVTFDREEDYRGAVVISGESLPAGVSALAGADFEPDKDPPRSTGKRERYTARTERAVVVLTASADAVAMKEPQIVRLVVRPVVDGKPGAVVASKEIPVMVVGKP
jgi:hypothetical protein